MEYTVIKRLFSDQLKSEMLNTAGIVASFMADRLIFEGIGLMKACSCFVSLTVHPTKAKTHSAINDNCLISIFPLRTYCRVWLVGKGKALVLLWPVETACKHY